MCRTPLYVNKYKDKQNKNTTQYVSDTSIRKQTQRQTKQKHNTICVGHLYT